MANAANAGRTISSPAIESHHCARDAIAQPHCEPADENPSAEDTRLRPTAGATAHGIRHDRGDEATNCAGNRLTEHRRDDQQYRERSHTHRHVAAQCERSAHTADDTQEHHPGPAPLLTSTTGAQRKYQMLGDATTARDRCNPVNGDAVSTQQVWERHGDQSIEGAVGHRREPEHPRTRREWRWRSFPGRGLGRRLYRRIHVCDRPRSETPIYPRTTSFAPPSISLIFAL